MLTLLKPWSPFVRGDSCSFVALDATTGALRWHFQFTPHDTHDWDASQVPVLVDAVVDGRARKLVVTANRNGFYYVLDRTTGEYLRGEPGKPFMGGGEVVESGDQVYGAVRALDVLTGERRWEHRLLSPLWAGVMATAGGLVFGSTSEGNVYALDASSGVALWDFQTGGSCAANPISFLLDGRQHVAVACGQALFAFGLP